MFNPNKALAGKAEAAAKKKALADLKAWSIVLIPADLHDGMIIDVNEVVCGDPTCAPIDTVFTLVWESGGKGVFALPTTASAVDRVMLTESFPDEEILRTWHSGKKARWPRLPDLRFKVQDRVECRIGPHPVKGWAPGRIIRLHYSEPNWPPNMVAPYQIALHDGRLIFAPQDTDQVIRLRPPPAPDAPSSPEYVPQEEGEYDEGEYDEGEYDEDGEMEEDEEGGDDGHMQEQQEEEEGGDMNHNSSSNPHAKA